MRLQDTWDFLLTAQKRHPPHKRGDYRSWTCHGRFFFGHYLQISSLSSWFWKAILCVLLNWWKMSWVCLWVSQILSLCRLRLLWDIENSCGSTKCSKTIKDICLCSAISSCKNPVETCLVPDLCLKCWEGFTLNNNNKKKTIFLQILAVIRKKLLSVQ